jgi:hypothetical protein
MTEEGSSLSLILERCAFCSSLSGAPGCGPVAAEQHYRKEPGAGTTLFK